MVVTVLLEILYWNASCLAELRVGMRLLRLLTLIPTFESCCREVNDIVFIFCFCVFFRLGFTYLPRVDLHLCRYWSGKT